MNAIIATLKNAPVVPDGSQRNGASKQYDAAVKQYIASVGKLSAPTIAANASSVLEALDPAEHSIGYLVALSNILQTSDPAPAINRTLLLDKVLAFLLKFDPCSIRYVGYSMVALLENVGSCSLFPPLIAVELLASAILRLDPSGSVFTSTHLILAKLAFASAHTEPALKVIDRDISFFPDMDSARDTHQSLFVESLHPTAFISSRTGLTSVVRSSEVLEYNLICGMIYISKRDWARAQRSLERVVSHPIKDKAPSLIMMEGYKKWVLVGLLNEGKAPTLPSYTSFTAKNMYAQLCTTYDNFARNFSTQEALQVREEAQANEQRWEEDGNTLLLAEVMTAYLKWQIINLRHIYQPVSVDRIRRMTLNAETGEALPDCEEVAAFVRNMIQSGMLKGDLQSGPTPEESFLAFQDAEASLSEQEFAQEIARLHLNVDSLSKDYQTTNSRLSSSKEFVRHVAREQKMQSSKEDGDRIELDDEDLMTGVVTHS